MPKDLPLQSRTFHPNSTHAILRESGAPALHHLFGVSSVHAGKNLPDIIRHIVCSSSVYGTQSSLTNRIISANRNLARGGLRILYLQLILIGFCSTALMEAIYPASEHLTKWFFIADTGAMFITLGMFSKY